MTNRVNVQPGTTLASVAAGLTLLGVFLLFVVPAALLDTIGINYGTPSGGPLEKVHPGTDLIGLATLVMACRAGNPLRYFAEALRRFPGVGALLAATVLLVIYLARVQAAPFTPEIDTFVMPALLFLLLVDLGSRSRRVMEVGLHIFVFGNAILGIVEFVTQWRLIPLQLNGLLLTPEMEWRASGLLGHPLASSAVAGLYAVIIALGCGRALPAWLRLPAILLQLAALGAFGGRTALVATILSLAILGLMRVLSLLAGRRFDLRLAGAALILAPLAGLAAVALVGSGFFDQLLARFVDDNGSAQSRAIILHLFSYLSWQDILIGPNQDQVATLQHLEGIEVGIESFWFGLILQVGLVMATLFFVALGLFAVTVMQQSDPKALVPLLFFILIVSSSVSLSAKSTSLGQFVVLVMILMPKVPQPVRAAFRMPHSSIVPA